MRASLQAAAHAVLLFLDGTHATGLGSHTSSLACSCGYSAVVSRLFSCPSTAHTHCALAVVNARLPLCKGSTTASLAGYSWCQKLVFVVLVRA